MLGGGGSGAGMMRTIFTDRSRIESFQRCNRLRWLEYHQGGVGLTPARKPLPLAVGGAVHVGLETLLRRGQVFYDAATTSGIKEIFSSPVWRDNEDAAVEAAVADLARYRNALAVDPNEQAAMATPTDLTQQMAATASDLGVEIDDPTLKALYDTQVNGRSQFDEYLWKEQSALVEGLVRAYARRRLRPLLEEFEVLEVEREGTWELARVNPDKYYEDDRRDGVAIVFCSRPDALLRSRADNSLYLMSFKTAASWDRRKELDAQHDMQGLSEGVEVERRLEEWWHLARNTSPVDLPKGSNKAMWGYLHALPAPPRILGIRYEYMLKFYRGEDKDLSQKFGFKVWSQRSSLVRAYFNHKTGDINASWEFVKEDGASSKLAWQNWKSTPVWNLGMTIKQWIDRLDTSTETMSAWDSTTGLEPRSLGWKSDAQATGYLTRHPLDEIFIAPITAFRQDDDLRDWLESTESQEVRIAESVAQIEAAADESERRSLLNRLMPMSRRACSYPVECPFAATICYASAEAKADPLATGKFVQRNPNHLAEKEALCESVQSNTSHGEI